ncbi:hypothetical protein TGARI_253020 [Toxoplasma gondii ARI]|uniref:Uncharacterized protein n=1 Tax=Toxoplasma gondii ARI TaxID=1074872 RepID=A0A139XST7_TOXGO|nr:hypothetical protein TGARI_253020 [Toxoplasma gondii ARI]
MERGDSDGAESPLPSSRGECIPPSPATRKRTLPAGATEKGDSSPSDAVLPEYVQFEVDDVRFFSQLLSVVIPHSAGNAASASLLEGGRESRHRQGATRGHPSGAEGDWNCVFIQWSENELLLRGVSRARDVYSELRLAASFFPFFEYKSRRSGRASRGRKRRRAANEACGDAEREPGEPGRTCATPEREEEGDRRDAEEQQVMVRVHELVNALMLFGENAHLRVRYIFDEGLLTLLLHERLLGRGGSEEEEALSEICVKTFSISQHEKLPDLCVFSPSCSSSSADYLRVSPQAFREVLVDLLGSDEEASGAAGSGDVRLSVFPPPLPSFAFPEDDKRQPANLQRHRETEEEESSVHVSPVAFTAAADETKPVIMRLSTSHQAVAQEVALGLDPLLFPSLQLTRTHEHTYKLRSLLSVVPALKLATGLRLEWHQDGLLLLQLLIKPQLQTRLFLHFYLFATVTQSEN